MTRLPKDYHLQRSCRDCASCFVQLNHDGPDQLYCTAGAPLRPISMAPGMPGEWPLKPDGRKSHDPLVVSPHMARWDAWSRGREVASAGVCKAWRDRP